LLVERLAGGDFPPTLRFGGTGERGSSSYHYVKNENAQTSRAFHFFVAGERHVLSGEIHISSFPAEISNSKWETSSFSYKNKSSRPIRILESPVSDLLDPEIRTFLSGISLITEILLD
jgi:hypothetical protein